MVYTVTLNPSLDYNANVDTTNPGKTNRTFGEYIVPGGKGLNVSIILARLGIESTAFGFCAGFTGEELKNLMANQGCKCDFITVNSGFTRINVKLVSSEVTEYNGSGITLGEEDIDSLKNKIAKLTPGDTLVLSGSIPKGIDEGVYAILSKSAPKGVKVIIDTTGEPLKRALPCNPFLIKPNIDELSEFFGTEIETSEDIVKYAKTLQNMGAQNVLVSLGEKGAVLVTSSGKEFYCDTPAGNFQNSVGAGDSMVAGFICEYSKSENMGKALKFSVASGSATAYSTWLAESESILKLYEIM